MIKIRFECPDCKSEKQPEFIGKEEIFYFELFVYECRNCKFRGFLGEFLKREPSVAAFHVNFYDQMKVI